MFRTLVRSNLIKRFNHTHPNFNFPDNHNKIVQDLLCEHNKHLDRICDGIERIGDGIGYVFFALIGIQITILTKL